MKYLMRDIVPEQLPESGAEWLESNIYFDAVVSPNNPGQLSFSRQPWAREILDNVLNPDAKQITLCCGAQSGKSTIMLCATLLLLRWKPSTMLWLLPTDALATRAVKKRILPLLSCNPCLASYLPPPKTSLADSLPLRGMQLYYTGVRTPSKLASIPARYLVCDEAAKFEHVKKDEADPVSLAAERVKSFADPLIIQSSTPNVEENQFWQSMMQSSYAQWYMPCVHCKKEFKFEWSNEMIKWEDGQPETACIICPHCGKSIDDAQRMTMIQAGHWVHTHQDAYERGHYGYHLNSLYSPYVTIGEMARKYHDACHAVLKSEALRNFRNSWEALPYSEHLTKVYDADIQSLINPMTHKGQVPPDFKMLLLGVDVGQNEQHWVVTALTPDNKIVVVDWGTTLAVSSELGQYGLSRLFDDLKYTDEGGNEYMCDFAMIDSGYNTQEVYNECLRCSVPGAMMPVKGSNTARGAWGRSAIRTIPDAPFELITFSDFQLKKALYLDAVKNSRLVLPAETDAALIQGLTGQEMIKTKTGKVQFKEVANDHFGDCVKYAILAGWIHDAETWGQPQTAE